MTEKTVHNEALLHTEGTVIAYRKMRWVEHVPTWGYEKCTQNFRKPEEKHHTEYWSFIGREC